MNPIRPLTSMPAQPTSTARPATDRSGDARAAFFQAVRTAQGAAPVQAPAPVAPRPQLPVQAAPRVQAEPQPAAQPQRFLRPGSLLDIKV